MSKLSVAVLFTTFNEAESLTSFIDECSSVLEVLIQKCPVNVALHHVDDCSTDGTLQIAGRLERERRGHTRVPLKVESTETRIGLARSLERGIKSTRNYDYTLVLDADFSHPPEVLAKLIQEVYLNHAHLVNATRFISSAGMDASGGKGTQKLLTIGLNKLLRLSITHRVTDYTGGFYIIKNNLFNDMPLGEIFYGHGEYFIRLVRAVSKLNIIKISEVPYVYEARRHGTAKTNLLRHGRPYLVELMRSVFRP